MFNNCRRLIIVMCAVCAWHVVSVPEVHSEAANTGAAGAKTDAGAAVSSAAASDIVTVKESFTKTFQNTPVTEIRPTPVDGMYEVLTNKLILYYFPKTGHIMMGGLWSKEGKDLTGDRYAEIMLASVKDLPLDKAVKVGKGKNQVIEITDPDCPFCRKADEYLKGRDDVTRYVFLYPVVQLHPDAEKKSKFILCQKEKKQEETLEEVMAGKYDGKPYEVCNSKDVDERITLFAEVGRKLNVRGTPMLIVNGHLVNGADIPAIQKYLGN